ncbi:MAG: nucleoside hydrolase [Roseitalea sp.]|nr:nucleoside hydrolase [Roseitalea sp.]MBO6741444.1 nucleoside hydrolase [Roseitalea sp.]
MSATPVLIDCDPGHDDAIALVMAHRSPDIDLLGVTTVCGNATLDRTTTNARRIMEFIGATDTPIAEGCREPLARPLVLGTADGPSGLDGTPDLPEASMALDERHAVDFIADTLASASEPITLVPTGPLTNIALFLLKYPHLKDRIGRIVLMGGAFYRRSEYITPTEFNIFCDPEAANIVVNSGVDVTMVGLDVTMHVLVEEPQFAELGKIDTPLGKVVLDWLAFYEKLHRGIMGVGGALHDPLALAVVIDPSLIETRPAHIAIDLTGSHMFGATVADFWNERGEGTNVTIATSVDSDRFFDLLYGLLRDERGV